MNYKELEKSIQQKLQNHEISMDTDQLVSDLFGKKNSKRPIPFWLLIGVAFLIAIVSGYFVFQTKASKQQTSVISKVSDMETNNVANNKKEVKVDKIMSIKESGNIVASELDGQTVNNIAEETLQEFSVLRSGNQIKKSNSIFLNTISPSGNSSKLKSNFSDTKLIKFSNKDLSPITIVSDDEVPQNSQRSILSLTKLYVPISPLLLSTDIMEPNMNLLPGVKCPSFKTKKPIRFSLIPEIGYFYPLTTFGSRNPVTSEVLDIRKQNETTLEGIQAALYGKVGWKAIPWYFKTGLNYGRITRRMDLDLSFVRKDTTIGIISITESQNGDTLTVIRGPIITDTKVTRKEIRHYYHHLWSIPIVVGYQKNYDYFSWAVEAGINFNMSSKQTGYVMTAPNEFGLVNNAGLYKSKVGISYLAQIQVGRSINEHNMLGLALRANINPNNFANNASTIDEKYQMIGINLFYEFKF